MEKRRRLLADKVGELAPKSLNDLRGYLFNIFEVARKTGGPWEGRPNPIEEVERFKVVPKPKKILVPTEWEPVLAEVPEEWQGPVATGLYAVMREGEIFGLRKEDVDLAAGVIMVSSRGTRRAPRTARPSPSPSPTSSGRASSWHCARPPGRSSSRSRTGRCTPASYGSTGCSGPPSPAPAWSRATSTVAGRRTAAGSS